MVTALTKHILEEGGKKMFTFTNLEHNIPDTLSRYTDVLKSVLKNENSIHLKISLSTSPKLSYNISLSLIGLHHRKKSNSKRRKEKKKVGRGIRVKIGNSIKIDNVESTNEFN